MFEHFYYKLTREQGEDLLKDKEFANRKGYLGLKIENLTDDELSETFNFIRVNLENPFIYYEPTNEKGKVMDIFDILHDDFYNTQFKRIVDFSKGNKKPLYISVLLYNGEEKSFLEEESFKESVKNFINDKDASDIPVLFYVKNLGSIGWAYVYFQESSELSLISHKVEEIYDFSGFQDYMCQITTKDLPPLSEIIHDSVVGHGWLARRAESKVLFTIYPKQDVEEVTERALLALRNTLSSELYPLSFILDLSILGLNEFKPYLTAFEEKYNQLLKKLEEIEGLYKEGEYEKANEESKKMFIRRNSAGIFDGLEDYAYEPDIVFYSFGVGLPGGSRTVYSITKSEGSYNKYIFEYISSWNGTKIIRRKDEEEYQAFVEDLKKATKKWSKNSYYRDAFDGYHEEIKCRDINLGVSISNDYPEDYDKFKKVLNKHFVFDNDSFTFDFKNIAKFIGIVIITPFFYIFDFLYDIYFNIKWWLKRKINKIKQRVSKEKDDDKTNKNSSYFGNKYINGIRLEREFDFLRRRLTFGKITPPVVEDKNSVDYDKIYLVDNGGNEEAVMVLGDNHLNFVKLNILMNMRDKNEIIIITDDFSKFNEIKEAARIDGYSVEEHDTCEENLRLKEKTLLLCKNKGFAEYFNELEPYEPVSGYRSHNGLIIIEDFNKIETQFNNFKDFVLRTKERNGFDIILCSSSFSNDNFLVNELNVFDYFVLTDSKSIENFERVVGPIFKENENIDLNNKIAVLKKDNEPVVAEDIDFNMFDCYKAHKYSKLKKY